MAQLSIGRFRSSTVEARSAMDCNVQFLLKRSCDQCLDAFANYKLFGEIIEKSCFSNLTRILKTLGIQVSAS